MIATEARLEANRRNARHPAGPNTEAGQQRSRLDALALGLSAEVVRLRDDTALAAPDDPAIDWTGFLTEQVGVLASRLGRCEALQRRHRGRAAYRAEHFWDDDRRLEAESLGAGIARDPAGVARTLRKSPQGCDWISERWALLARAADRDGGWTPEQRGVAFDLLGRPAEFRGDDPSEESDAEGRALPTLGLAGLARREIAALARRKADLAPADELGRSWARHEPDESDDPALRRLRRLEADLHRRLRWTVAQLAKAQPAALPPAPPPPQPTRSPIPHEPSPGLLDDLPSFDDLLDQAEAHLDAEDRRLARPSNPRPDPKLARKKAREAARRDKRRR